MHKNKTIVIVISLLLVVAIASTVYAFIYIKNNSDKKTDEKNFTERLSSDASKDLLQSIIQNNPVTSLASGVNQASKSTGGTRQATEYALAASDQAISGMIFPTQDKYNYTHTKTETDRGPAASRCSLFNYTTDGKFESYNYYDYSGDNFSFYSKSVSYDKQNDLTDYYLDANGENTQYRGGKYAVKTKYETVMPLYDQPESDKNTTDSAEPDVAPSEPPPTDAKTSTSSSPETLDDYVNSYFGKDAVVEKVVKDGEITEYIVTWKYETSCDYLETIDTLDVKTRDTDPIKNQNTNVIYIKSWFDPETYVVTKEIDYLDSVSDQNILVTTQTEAENKQTSFENVKDQFKFEFNVPIKEVNYTTTQEDYLLATDKFLQDKPMNIIYPVDPKFEFEYLYSNYIYNFYESVNNYLLDRDFYMDGKKGDQLFEDAKKSFIPFVDENAPYVDYNYSYYNNDYTDYTLFIVQIYKDATDSNTIVSRLVGLSESKVKKATKTAVTIKINGETVQAEVYSISNEYYIGKPVPSDDVCSSDSVDCLPPDQEKYAQMTFPVVFSYKGMKYALNVTGKSVDTIDDIIPYLNGKSFDTSKESERKTLMGLIEKAYTKVRAVDGGDGTGSSTGSAGSTEPAR